MFLKVLNTPLNLSSFLLRCIIFILYVTYSIFFGKSLFIFQLDFSNAISVYLPSVHSNLQLGLFYAPCHDRSRQLLSVFLEKDWKNFAKFTGNTCEGDAGFHSKFCEIFQSCYSVEHLRRAASVILKLTNF